ncbi:hypothetical protein [Streptomyces spectabilis]|uniref:Uncharacterized protein n=1 Tax=Streptomyces spectabilis TaxID=68270 RepID=A0A7W8EYK0_STRST|nr:hypothetical protein [Streptomyces spectabilis]MBB5108164.1 hypothetical protein [Streptomyces spectabilis]MCI3904386.1 hypothetical protein [Streptomyces spectabilis]GGV26895.1 hypothetical protein GCM10010245_44190 [Streptomyces spectabilis]
MTAAPHPTAEEPVPLLLPPLSFVVPDGFHHLPVDASADELPASTAAFVRNLYPAGEAELWNSAAPYYEQVAALLSTAGLLYSGLGIFGMGDEGVAHCSFSVAVCASQHADTEAAAQGMLAILSGDPLNDARWLDLPCGPAVSCVSMRELSVDAEQTTASEEQARIITGQIQIYLPFPTGPYMAVFTLSTASMQCWGEFCDMLTAVLQTVSFTDPEEPDDG